MRMESCHYLLAGVVLLVLTSCPFCHTWLFSDEQTTPAGTDLIKALWALNVTIDPPSSSVERETLRSSLDLFIRFLECVCKSASQACFNDFQKTQSSLKHTNHTNAIYSSSLSVLSSCHTALSQRWILCEVNEASGTFRKYTNCAKSVSTSPGCVPIYALMNIDSNQYFEVYTENRDINVALCQGKLSIGESEIQLYTDKSTATDSQEEEINENMIAIIIGVIVGILVIAAIIIFIIVLLRRRKQQLKAIARDKESQDHPESNPVYDKSCNSIAFENASNGYKKDTLAQLPTDNQVNADKERRNIDSKIKNRTTDNLDEDDQYSTANIPDSSSSAYYSTVHDKGDQKSSRAVSDLEDPVVYSIVSKDRKTPQTHMHSKNPDNKDLALNNQTGQVYSKLGERSTSKKDLYDMLEEANSRNPDNKDLALNNQPGQVYSKLGERSTNKKDLYDMLEEANNNSDLTPPNLDPYSTAEEDTESSYYTSQTYDGYSQPTVKALPQSSTYLEDKEKKKH